MVYVVTWSVFMRFKMLVKCWVVCELINPVDGGMKPAVYDSSPRLFQNLKDSCKLMRLWYKIHIISRD